MHGGERWPPAQSKSRGEGAAAASALGLGLPSTARSFDATGFEDPREAYMDKQYKFDAMGYTRKIKCYMIIWTASRARTPGVRAAGQ